uniref:Uncharacterized protein n=1 Tax=Rhizophora mucronata TaxID=61149 RepID=A0A2P2MNE4_RHIMU
MANFQQEADGGLQMYYRKYRQDALIQKRNDPPHNQKVQVTQHMMSHFSLEGTDTFKTLVIAYQY